MNIEKFKQKIVRKLQNELVFQGVTFHLNKLPQEQLEEFVERAIRDAKSKQTFIGSSFIEVEGFLLQLTVFLQRREASVSAYLGTYEDYLRNEVAYLGTIHLL